MELKLINRPTKDNTTQPQVLAALFAARNGFTLCRQPFGKRGSLIEIYRGGEMIGYRKSYRAALTFMERACNDR
ncbi:MAG: hypothetical protein H6944_11285 [Zoogloeaceae bacterium]|nr:hypothetical protein [Rhodocyclaceae bacterium]MCP5222258.1 hypothetical protein [Zoogloeaceae bacterium]